MRILNRALCFIFFLLLVYLYAPVTFGDDEQKKPKPKNEATKNKKEESLDDRIRRLVQERLKKKEKAEKDDDPDDEVIRRIAREEVEEYIDENLPDVVESEVEAALKAEKRKAKARDDRWRTLNSRRGGWSLEGGPQKPILFGRQLVGPTNGGAYGVLVDTNIGANVMTDEGSEGVRVYKAKITPFYRIKDGGAQIGFNVKRFLKDQIITKTELRDEVDKLDFTDAFVYYRFINTEKVEVVGYIGQVSEPFVREVVESSVFINKSILDKYSLNSSMAIRADVGFLTLDNANPNIIERPIWIQAASFNMVEDSGNFQDFAVRVIMSLALVNKLGFKGFNLKPFQVWGGFARVGSGTVSAGEQDKFFNNPDEQEMFVVGTSIDLASLTGKDFLGTLYGEFVRRRISGKHTDQSWVVGWEGKYKREAGGRPIEYGFRYQSQQDDPDAVAGDGQVIQGSIFYPLADYNIGVRGNLGYVIKSSDPGRDGEVFVSADLEVLF